MLLPRSSEFAPSPSSSCVICRLGGHAFVLVSSTPCHTLCNTYGCLFPHSWQTVLGKSSNGRHMLSQWRHLHTKNNMPTLQAVSPLRLRELQQHQTHKARSQQTKPSVHVCMMTICVAICTTRRADEHLADTVHPGWRTHTNQMMADTPTTTPCQHHYSNFSATGGRTNRGG